MSIKYFCDSCKKEIEFSDSIHFEQEDNDRGVTYFPEGTVFEDRYDCDNPIIHHTCKECEIKSEGNESFYSEGNESFYYDKEVSDG